MNILWLGNYLTQSVWNRNAETSPRPPSSRTRSPPEMTSWTSARSAAPLWRVFWRVVWTPSWMATPACMYTGDWCHDNNKYCPGYLVFQLSINPNTMAMCRYQWSIHLGHCIKLFRLICISRPMCHKNPHLQDRYWKGRGTQSLRPAHLLLVWAEVLARPRPGQRVQLGGRARQTHGLGPHRKLLFLLLRKHLVTVNFQQFLLQNIHRASPGIRGVNVISQNLEKKQGAYLRLFLVKSTN